MWSHFVFIFKVKEQNKLSGGGNGLVENEREKSNNLLNNLGVKGLVESFKLKKALQRLKVEEARDFSFERRLQTCPTAGIQYSVGNSGG